MEDLNIKKTMVEALSFVTEHGNMSAGNLSTFINSFCVAKSVASGKPREYIKLYDIDGNVLGRKCSVSHKWLLPISFSGDVMNTGISKQADKVKNRFLTEARAMEREATHLLETARGLIVVEEKLEAFESYDVAMQAAKAHKLTDCTELVVFQDDVEVFNSVEELAEHLGVDVILTVQKEGEDGK